MIKPLNLDVVSGTVMEILPHLVGKTIAGIVVSKGRHPHVQWHLVFTDQTTYELYSESDIQAGAHLHPGTISIVASNGCRNDRSVSVFVGDVAAKAVPGPDDSVLSVPSPIVPS